MLLPCKTKRPLLVKMDIPGEVIIPKTPDYIVTKQPNSTTRMPKTSFGIKSAKNSKENDKSIPELEALRYRDEVIVKQIKPHCLKSTFKYLVLN